MIIERNPFMIPQNDDDILAAILFNEYSEDTTLCSDQNCSLQTIVPPKNTPKFLAATSYLHTFLPHEINSSNFNELYMVDKVTRVEVSLGKELNISKNLTPDNFKSIVELLQDNQKEFTWEYIDMKGLDPKISTHRIYITSKCKPIKKPQQRVNHALRDIVKIELQKILNA